VALRTLENRYSEAELKSLIAANNTQACQYTLKNFIWDTIPTDLIQVYRSFVELNFHTLTPFGLH
jgi:hypothetical protein